MRILVISDISDLHWYLGEGKADLLISCGDVPDQVILEAAQAYRCNKILGVKGNHDLNSPFPSSIVDLHLKVVHVGSLSFAGFNGAWRYKQRGHFLYEQDEVAELMMDLPPADIFVSHNSPRYIHDREDGIHFGFNAFTDYLSRSQTKLMLHGHQHQELNSMLNSTWIAGVYGARIFNLPEP